MQPPDIPAVYTIESQVYDHPWTEAIFHDCLSVDYQCWVVEHDQQVIAYLIYSIVLDECHLLNIAVHPDYHNQGYGKALMQFLLTQAKQANAAYIYLEVRITSRVAIELYKKFGFRLVGKRKKYYKTKQGHEDALVFCCEL